MKTTLRWVVLGPLAVHGQTVYVADRSKCPGDRDVCPWPAPPRYREDVLAAAEAFYQANAEGTGAPDMQATLDLILTRRPRPYPEIDLPFEVYVGGGKTVSIEAYLADHPHPTYVALEARDRGSADSRYYFAAPYRSWHGSPSRDDSEIPLIVARARSSRAEIHARVAAVLAGHPAQQKIADLILALAR